MSNVHQSMRDLNLMPEPGTAEAVAWAAKAKAKGNEAFTKGDFRGAVHHFSQAIKADSNDKVFFSNRSAAYASLSKFDEAAVDAQDAVDLDPTWSKAWLRLGYALFKLDRLHDAKTAYESGLEHEPESRQLQDSLTQVQDAINKHELANEPVIGIDLGTTFSCVAVWKDGKAVVLPNANGNLTTPSWVAFTEHGRRVVGDAAKRQAASNTQGTLFNIKRIIGQQYHECLDEIKSMPFKVVQHGSNGRPVLEVDGQQFQPEQISAMVLEEMKHTAETALGRTVNKAVITVPAYFNDAQRRLTKDAGAIAGLDVLRIINEPTAAALAYGLDLKAKNSISEEAEEIPATNVLVFDLGGGTFDVSLLYIHNGVFEVKATAGDTHLGGEDFDKELSEWVRGEIRKERGHDLVKGNDKAIRKLRSACELAKRELSSRQSTFVDVSIEGEEMISIPLTRARLEEVCDKSIQRCMISVERVLRDAKCERSEVDEIVLVGGSTRIPYVQQILSEYFGGKVLCKSVNPDEAVAIGAAIQGAILSGMRSSATDNLLLVDVVPLSLGIECQNGVFAIVVPRNTSIPCRKSHEFTTVDDFQTSVDIRIFEGERGFTDGNHLLGEFTINDIQKAKKGVPKIDVCFDLNANGLLTVSAHDKVSGAKANVELNHDIGRLSAEEIKSMQEEAAKYRREDAQRVREAERESDREARIDDKL